MKLNIFVIFVFLNVEFVYSSSDSDIYSYIERNYAENKVQGTSVTTEIERMYISGKININTENLVCALTDARKRALCSAVYKINHYRTNMEVYLNRIALYMMKLSCRKNKLSFRLLQNEDQTSIQEMYPCPARHKIIRTSFVEDEYFDLFYLSSGFNQNSVTIFVRSRNIDNADVYYVYDYLYNVDLSNLEDLSINLKSVLGEIKLNNKMFIIQNSKEVEMMYIKKQKYLIHDDPICDLEYEKKISLCNTIFQEFHDKNIFEITLNMSAAYILDLSCVTRPVHIDFIDKRKIILQEEQKLYPCYGRDPVINKKNLLTDKLIKKIYISSGSQRNSVFVYMRNMPAKFLEFFSLFNVVGNINLRNLKPTVVTVDNVITESLSTYIEVQKIINEVEKEHDDELISIATSKISQTEEDARIKKLVGVEKSFGETIKKVTQTNSFYSNQFSGSITEDKDEQKKYYNERMFIVNVVHNDEANLSPTAKAMDLKDMSRIGPQVYKKLLQKKRNELLVVELTFPDSPKNRIRRRLAKKITNVDELSPRSRSLYKEVQQLIKKMESISFNSNKT